MELKLKKIDLLCPVFCKELMNKYKHIILGSDHYNTLGIVRSLGEVGIKPDIILHPKYHPHPHMANNSKYVRNVFIVSSPEECYQKLIQLYSDLKEKPFVYTCDDWVGSIVDEHMDELKDRFYFFHGKTAGIISHFQQKDVIHELAKKYGLNVAKSELIKKGDLPKTLSYPVITKSIKSVLGAWKSDVFICKNEKELIQAFAKIKSKDILVEEYIERETEYYYDAFSINNGANSYFPYKAQCLRAKEGEYGNYLRFTSLPPHHIDNLHEIDCVKKMIQEIGYTGIFEAEFLKGKDGKLYFLEINFRNSTWSYPMTFGGVNMPYLWAKGSLFGFIEESEIHPSKDSFIGLVEFKEFKDFVLSGKINPFVWIYQVAKADMLFFYNKNDSKPFWMHVKQLLMSVFVKFIK